MESIRQASSPLPRVSTPVTTDAEAAIPSRVELPGSKAPGLEGCSRLKSGNPSENVSVSVLLKPTGNGLLKSTDDTDAARSNASQIADLKAFAKANGLKIASIDPATRTVKLEGSAHAQEKAFGVKLNNYKDAQGRTFRSYDGAITLPKNLAGSVQGVLGLSNRPIAEPRNTGFKPNDTPAKGFNPVDVAKMYHFPQGTDGSGQTIAIVELGGGYNQADMEKYFKKMGIATPNIKSVSVDGAQNADDGDTNGPDGEVALDIQVAGAMAPGANIVVYFAPNTEQGFVDAINQAAHDDVNKPITISNSWGSPEGQGLWSPQAMQAMDGVLKDAANHGVSVFTASGDHGSQDFPLGQGDGQDHVDFPSASPWNISTGGTQISTDSQGNLTGEVGWSLAPDGWGGGGGVSTVFPKPDFQQGANVPGNGRGVPDVAGNAASASGFEVMFDGVDGAIGGTSAVAPLYAALAARLAQGNGGQLPFLNPFFYRHPEAFNDITQGNNGTFNAGPGWDPVTGLGSPDGDKLLAALKAEQGS